MTEPAPLLPALSGADQRELVDALLDAFPSPDELKQFVRLWLDKNLDEIAGNAGLRTVVFELIRHTESHGTTGALLSAAITANPGNPKLRAFMQKRSLPVPVLKETRPWPEPTPGWRRALLLAAVGILALLGLGWVFRDKLWPPELPAVAPSAAPSATLSLPVIQPFAPNTRGIVLAGPWKEDAPNPPLHEQLRKLDAQEALRRVPFWSHASHDELLRQATTAKAVLVVEVGPDGMAQVYPLGPPANNALFRGPIAIAPARNGAAVVINALAHASSASPDLPDDKVPCPELGSDSLDRFALLALLLVPSCQSVSIDPQRFRGVCGRTPNPADELCALSLYAEAEHSAETDPRAAGANLEKLVRNGPVTLQRAAKLKLAGLVCRDKATAGRALDLLNELNTTTEPCVLAQLPEIASCIVTTRRAAAEGPGGELGPLEIIEASQIDPQGVCPAGQRAGAMARRAYWRGRRGSWEAATAEYKEAYDLVKEPAYALSEAEGHLQQNQPTEAHAALDRLGAMALTGRGQAMRLALLRWVAARQEKNARALSTAEDGLVTLFQARAEAGAHDTLSDEDLRALVCGAPARSPCTYDVLQGGPSASLEKLKASFKAR